MNRFLLALVCALLVPASVSAQQKAAGGGQATAAVPESAADAFVRAYAEAFNRGDAAAVAAMWCQDCTHVDRETGKRTAGRESVLADITAALKERPGARLSGTVHATKQIKPDVVLAHGETTLIASESEPVRSEFSAVLIQEGGKWLIASLEESAVVPPASPREALRELGWLVGRWVDEAEGSRVDTTFRWSPHEAFLIRSYRSEDQDGNVQEGTQIIGWDPRAQQIRSWSFNSDGSFGDGTWLKNGGEWLIKSSQTLADGRAASGTYVASRVDENTIKIQLIGHEIEGELSPASEAVTMVRVPETTDAATAPSAAPNAR